MRTLDWQTITVALIIAAAFLYVARRAWARLSSFITTGRGGGASDSSCATGCGKCGDDDRQKRPTHPARVLVQLQRSKKI